LYENLWTFLVDLLLFFFFAAFVFLLLDTKEIEQHRLEESEGDDSLLINKNPLDDEQKKVRKVYFYEGRKWLKRVYVNIFQIHLNDLKFEMVATFF
jgi:hypothetical protein